MSLSIDQVAAVTAKSGASRRGVRVTEKVVKRAAEDAGQACISVRGLDEYRGDVTVRVGETDYVITKTDTHAAWSTKQGDNTASFVALFNVLAETPNKVQGDVNPSDS